ncbi:MAG: phosphoribosyl-AMP cyclohydrolase [Pseudomonadota bacterium]
MKKLLTTLCAAAILPTVACAEGSAITKQDVLMAQKQWGEGIVAIGQAYQSNGDYKSKAAEHIRELYAYDQSEVLFKPTLASNDQFRESFDAALSYFVGGAVSEDKGFAIKPWSNVRFGDQQIITNEDSAIAMGNYFFTPVGSNEETKVEYTFGYMKDQDGNLRINVHHSSLPFDPS